MLLLRATILCLLATPLTTSPQVVSLTVGIDVNSPYGLSEPWFTLRNALLRCDDFQTVAERPDVKTATAEVTTKDRQLPDLAKLQRLISESGAGASLRGVEATIEGELGQTNNKWVLRIPGKEIPLQPLTVLVQQERKKPRPATAEELNARERLLKSGPTQVRVTGPLRFEPTLALEVRAFEQKSK